MEDKILKRSKTVCYLALVFWGIWTLVIIMRLMRFMGIINFNVFLGIDIVPIVWFDDEAIIAQCIELAGYIITNIAMICLAFLFITKSLKGIKVNEVFTRVNVRILYIMAAVSFFYELFQANRSILYGNREVVLDSDPFTTTLIILIVAVFYKLALCAYEENRLTI
ncbi:MAG: hypothetical protein MJY52_01825 [Bacteroidaceae bacterium]|nr:hypothetical protein [Bacteroidaceae bacterium]